MRAVTAVILRPVPPHLGCGWLAAGCAAERQTHWGTEKGVGVWTAVAEVHVLVPDRASHASASGFSWVEGVSLLATKFLDRGRLEKGKIQRLLPAHPPHCRGSDGTCGPGKGPRLPT